MSEQIQFEHTIPYRPIPPDPVPRPALNIRLCSLDWDDDLVAVFDSGADYCLFSGTRAKRLGIELNAGRRLPIQTAAGHFWAFVHTVVIEIEWNRFTIEAAFSEHPIPREVLGRHSLFEQTTWAIREYRQELYFSPRP